MSDVPVPDIAMIWAEGRGGVIGDGGPMLWHVPEDLARFKSLTLGHPVVMGRKTWDSLPPAFRPLEGRPNIVITRQKGWEAAGAEVADSADRAIDLAGAGESAVVWITGGGAIYAQFMATATRLEVTEVNGDYSGATRAPTIGDDWQIVARDPEAGWHLSRTGIEYRFLTYRRSDTR